MTALARPAAIALGVGADAVFGDPARWHPVAGFGRAAAALERVAHRPTRRAGAVYAVLLTGTVATVAAAVQRALRSRPAALVLVQATCLWAALGGRSLAGVAGDVADAVAAGDLPAARTRIRALVGRDPAALDGAGLCRATIESVAENTVDAVVAPLLWAAAGGAPAVLAHRAVNTLDAMVGNRSERHARFGTASARADDAANWPAARLTGALTVALAPAVHGSPRDALDAWRRDAAAHPSPNAGVAEAAFAGALGLRLGGTLAYAGRVEHRPELGDGRRDATPADVRRAITLARAVSAAAAAAVLVATAVLAVLAAGGWRR